MTMYDDDYVQFMERLRAHLIEFEEIEHALEKRLDILIEEESGGSLIILGPQSSGKLTIVKRVLSNYKDRLIVDMQDGQFDDVRDYKVALNNMEQTLKSTESAKKVVFVVKSFDRMPSTFANKVLYWLAQQQKHYAYLLILLGERENAVQSFEKRIASRIAQNIIRIAPTRRSELDDWILVCDMMDRAAESCSNNFRKALRLPKDVPDAFKNVREKAKTLSTSYGTFKAFLVHLVDEIKDAKAPITAAELLNRKVPPQKNNQVVYMLRGINLRMYGLLIAAAIAGHQCANVEAQISLNRIYKKYLSFANTYGKNVKHLRLDSNEQHLQMDAAYLESRGIWAAKRQGDHIISTSWIIDPIVVLEKRTLFSNTGFEQWIAKELSTDTHMR